MANKLTSRHFENKDQNIISEERHYKDVEGSKVYADNYVKRYYRTIGFKLNVYKEKDILAWLDFQEQLKYYIVGLIKEDMLKNPEKVAKAIEFYDMQHAAAESGAHVRQGDILMKCPECGYTTAIRLYSYYNKPQKHICPECRNSMEAVNPPNDEQPNFRK